MNSNKYLFRNIGLLSISNISSKILAFLIVPIYTAVLTTGEYGIFDVVNTTVNLLVPILTVNISESVLRFSIDEEKERKNVFSTGLLYAIYSLFIVVVLIIINHIFKISKVFENYSVLFFFMFACETFAGLLNSFARGIDKVKAVSASEVIRSIAVVCLAILFLLNLKLGIKGYFLAIIIGSAVQIIYLFFAIKAYRFITFKINKCIEMPKYSIPLVANTVGWWVNNVSDRYIVASICGFSANGVYSVAYKIPAILHTVQTIFNQAWVLSAVKNFDREDKNGFFIKIYNLYNFFIVFLCSALIAGTKLLAGVLYSNDFYSAWKYAPFLLISCVFGAMAGYIGGIFAALKNSKIYSQSTVIGAVVNIVLNIVLVKLFGIMGAAITTAVSYFIVWLIRIITLKKYMNLSLKLLRDSASYLLLVVQASAFLILKSSVDFYVLQIVLFCIIVLLYTAELKMTSAELRKKRAV